MGLSPVDWQEMSLVEFIISHDAYLLDRWDHTALTAALTHNLSCIVVGLASKHPPKHRTASYYHPYRESKSGFKIGPNNIQDLKTLAAVMVGCKSHGND